MARQIFEVEPHERQLVEWFRWLPEAQQRHIAFMLDHLASDAKACAIAEHRGRVLRLVIPDRTNA